MCLRAGIFLCVLLAAAGAGDSGDELADTAPRECLSPQAYSNFDFSDSPIPLELG